MSLSWRSPWPLRIAWLVLPFVAGPAIADAFADRSRAVQVVGSTLAWAGWALALAALGVLRTVTLTATRLLVPGALPLAVWAAVDADRAWWATAGVAISALCLVLLAGPGLSDAFVDGSSYGPERRVALRVPPGLLLVPLPLAWAVAAVGVATGPLLLAAEQWVAGGVALVLGAGVLVVAVPRIHTFSRRWLVFVPAGVVVHDPLTLHDAILFPRSLVERFGPATLEAAGDVVDATGGALGLVLEIRSSEDLKVGVRAGRSVDERAGVRGLLVTPTQPAATLALATEGRLPVG